MKSKGSYGLFSQPQLDKFRKDKAEKKAKEDKIKAAKEANQKAKDDKIKKVK